MTKLDEVENFVTMMHSEDQDKAVSFTMLIPHDDFLSEKNLMMGGMQGFTVLSATKGDSKIEASIKCRNCYPSTLPKNLNARINIVKNNSLGTSMILASYCQYRYIEIQNMLAIS